MKRAIAGGLAVVLSAGLFGIAAAEDAPKPDAPAAGDKDKMHKCHEQAAEKFKAKVPELIKAADADANGEISDDEFKSLLQSARKARAEIIKACRAEAGLPDDPPEKHGRAAKGSGDKASGADAGLSKEERRKKREEEEKARFDEAKKKADANSDGKITADEASQFVLSAPEKGEGGHGEKGEKSGKSDKESNK